MNTKFKYLIVALLPVILLLNCGKNKFPTAQQDFESRGDVNLNQLSFEIADAVLLSNYFLYGEGVFTVNQEKQIKTTDVNLDGLTTTVADLAYLIRNIVGDALPVDRVKPLRDVIVTNSNGVLTVDRSMGAALVIIVGNAHVELLADNVDLRTVFDGTNTRVLVYSLDGNSFSGDFLATGGKIVSLEFGSAEGATVSYSMK